MSDPSATGIIEDATADAAPPLEPPADMPSSKAFEVAPNNVFLV